MDRLAEVDQLGGRTLHGRGKRGRYCGPTLIETLSRVLAVALGLAGGPRFWRLPDAICFSCLLGGTALTAATVFLVAPPGDGGSPLSVTAPDTIEVAKAKECRRPRGGYQGD
jgi:hypothetical protein